MSDHNFRFGGMGPVDDAIYARRRANKFLFVGFLSLPLLIWGLVVPAESVSSGGATAVLVAGFLLFGSILYRLYVAVVY